MENRPQRVQTDGSQIPPVERQESTWRQSCLAWLIRIWNCLCPCCRIADRNIEPESSPITQHASMPSMSPELQTAQAIIDGNYSVALQIIRQRMDNGEISPYSDNLEGRALQGDWGMVRSLAEQRLRLAAND